MRKVLGYFLSPIVIAAALLALIIFRPIQWILHRFFGYKAYKKAIDQFSFLLINISYMLGNKVVFINKQNLPVGRPIIFVANHQGIFDILPIIYYLRKYHAKFISKIELAKGLPSISYYLKVSGGANIDRKNPRQSLMEIARLGTRMKENNWSAVIFPEGTRSAKGKVNTFQAAGVATILKKCPEALLVPVALNSWRMVQYGFPFSTFERITCEVLAPIEPGKISAEELVKQAEDMIREALPAPGLQD